MAEVIPYRFKLRGGTAAEWASANPVLLGREPGIETDTLAIKIGDGTRPWNQLPYSGRNTQSLLADADAAAASRINAEDLPALRNRVNTLETSGTGGTTYNDAQLRTDMANADTATLNSAKSHTNGLVTPLTTRVETIEARPKNVVLTQTQYDALSTKDANTLYFIRS